jgi:hypothetical protein
MKIRKSLITALLVFGVIVGFWIGLPLYQKSKLALPSDVVTLAEFSVRMPKPEKVIAFEKNGSSYVEVIGSPPGFPTVPSGPPTYIFDSTGHISYWTIDVGDSSQYWNNWQNRSNSREVSMREALQSVVGKEQ